MKEKNKNPAQWHTQQRKIGPKKREIALGLRENHPWTKGKPPLD